MIYYYVIEINMSVSFENKKKKNFESQNKNKENRKNLVIGLEKYFVINIL